MPHETIAARIEKLTETLGQNGAADISALASAIRANLEQASASLLRGLYILVMTWLVSFAIGAGLVSEGQFASFKVTTVQSLLVFVPAFVGFQYYLIASSVALMWVLREALHFLHKRRLPPLYDFDLEYLLDPPTFMSAEDFFDQRLNRLDGISHRISQVGGFAMAAGVLFSGIAVFIHVSYLALKSSGLPWYAGAASVGLGLVAVARAFMFLLNADAITRT